ncbi:hypothetical protein [Sphingomonas sp. NIBR02145]|uniref:hypothetical protein n=1 Tax=Sphingomonas sp. NIBR02145 TaxID=3014784 RepID=UPI0022B53E96|nr:hypothetical protein [Sphingomonas sp. NIBR02145]WHU05000.1 hypothetical protein O3305_10545 [Sphingomonas sp. NIBR02145]
MHDRRTHRTLSDIALLRSAERLAAYQALADARAREREAEEAASRADARATAAAEDWSVHLAGSDFAPELARALADDVVAQGERAVLARNHCLRMADQREESEQDWHDGDARCRLADRALSDSRRARQRERDERLLALLADRTALLWRRA